MINFCALMKRNRHHPLSKLLLYSDSLSINLVFSHQKNTQKTNYKRYMATYLHNNQGSCFINLVLTNTNVCLNIVKKS